MIARRLREVLDIEKIKADDAAVAVLAREAAGSMRDAMSLLDQVIAFKDEGFTGEDVARVLGVADRQVLHDLSSAVVGGDAAAALSVIDRLAQQGFDMVHVAKDVLLHLRNLVVARVCGEGGRELLDLADEEVKDVVDLAARAEPDDLLRLYQGFSKSFDDIQQSKHPRSALEMTLVRLARRPPLLPLDELLARVGELEKRLSSGAPPPAPRGGGGGGGRPAQASSITSAFSVPIPTFEGGETRGALALKAPEPPPRPKPIAPPVAPPADQLAQWRAILERVAQKKPALAGFLSMAMPLDVRSDRVVLGFEEAQSFAAGQVKEPDALDLLTREVRAHFGKATEIAIDLSSERRVETVADIDAARRKAEIERMRAELTEHPLVKEALRVFGAELREVKLPAGEE
jgi:DNA polymerase-3 subunit gamma/tau